MYNQYNYKGVMIIMARTAYLGSTIFVTDKKYLFSYIGQNGDTAFVVNPNTKKILAEFTKYDKDWVPVNTGDESSVVLKLDELERVVSALQENVDIVISNFNTFDRNINEIKENLTSINTDMEKLDINTLSNIPEQVETVADKANSNLLKIATLTEDLTNTKTALENIQSAYVKSIEVNDQTSQLVITKQDNNKISIDLETGGAGTLSSDDLSQMWGD